MTAPQNETMVEGLRKVVAQIAQLNLLPDADLNFLTSVQASVTGYLRDRAQAASNIMAAPTPPMGPGGAAGPGAMGMGQGGGPPGMSQMGGVQPGLSPGAPAVDELTRLLGSSSQVA